MSAQRSRLIRRQRAAVMVATLCALASTAGLISSAWIRSPLQAAAETRPPTASVLTGQVEHRVLVNTIVLRGQVAATTQVTVAPAARQGTDAVVTRTPLAVGEQVNAGDLVIEVSGRPVVALPGNLPMYRDLKPDDDGKDVAQLQNALRTLGFYAGGDGNGRFGAATKSAVRRMYAKIGYDAPDTGGPGGAGDRASLQGAQAAVDAAQRAVDDLNRRIAAAGGTPPAPGEEPLAVQLGYLKKALDQARLAEAELVARTGPMLPAAEVVFLPIFPARVVRLGGRIGDQAAAPLLSLAAGALAIRAKPTPDQARLLKPGMPVDIAAEAIGGQATGRVDTVGTVTTDRQDPAGEQSAAGGDRAGAPAIPGPPYVPVTVSPAAPLDAAWADLDVRLTVTSAQTAGPVLVVPLSAVSSRADGRTTVSKLLDNGKAVRVDVRAGASGDGFVEVTPLSPDNGLAEGDRVLVGG